MSGHRGGDGHQDGDGYQHDDGHRDPDGHQDDDGHRDDDGVPIAKSFYDLSATSLQGEKVDFNVFRGTTVRDYTQLNQLQARYPRRLVVLGFPCNQFGFQENGTNEEILSILKHVRPGGGFEPNFTLFQKCQVNGTDTHPVFAYLKLHLPTPADEASTLMSEPRFLSWSPVRRSDISWNFEKFLVGPEGEPFRRYSPRMATAQLEPDIQRLLKLAK
uniref:Glutathione peroxidase n=1 Tax=Strigops habroptila TaxID=2489341 RepID=A0A672V2F2_STRHB